jgi:hypothetical protein
MKHFLLVFDLVPFDDAEDRKMFYQNVVFPWKTKKVSIYFSRSVSRLNPHLLTSLFHWYSFVVDWIFDYQNLCLSIQMEKQLFVDEVGQKRNIVEDIMSDQELE